MSFAVRSRSRSLNQPTRILASVGALLPLACTATAFAGGPSSIRLSSPTRMLNTKTLTIRAELLDAAGRIDWREWNRLGTVSATRVSNGQPVPLTVTVFERHTAGAGTGGPPTTDSIRFYNGVGCVSFTLNNGASVPAGAILVTVTVDGVSASRTVTILDAATPGLVQDLSGTLSGGNLTWEPADGVIHLTGNVTVPAGQTLTIQPGTLIMVDPGPNGAGTTIISVNSSILAPGLDTAPIYFFPTTGAAAMVLPQNGSQGSSNGHNNPSSWGGFELAGTGVMTWSYVFMAGTGNGVVSGHPRPTVIRLADSHAFTATDSVFADSPGKILYGNGGGAYTFQRCLFARNGIGGEFIGVGYTLLMEDTWMTRIGRAPINTSNRLDGDILHIDQISNTRLRGCILTDGGDDVIDHSSGATPIVENTIIYDANDKVLSISGGTGSITMTNCLVFNVPGGLNCTGAPAYLTNVTIGNGTNIFGAGCGSVIQQTILWPGTHNSCCGLMNYTSVGNTGDVACGIGNIAANPLFIDPNFNPPADVFVDFGLQAGSPARTAGPGGTQIGWLGFGLSTGCLPNPDCNDNNPCTTDVCSNGVCSNTPIAGCCQSPAECNDNDPCTTDGCSGNVCTHTPVNCGDGNACTTDSCLAGVGCQHVSVNCDDGNACTIDSCNALNGCQNTPVSCPPGQQCNPSNGSCEVAPTTVSFQDGVTGYSGTVDTYLQQQQPAVGHGADTVIRWDTEDSGPSTPIYALIRFDNIFGNLAGQIPPGSTITSATLTCVIGSETSATGDAGDLRETNVSWNEAETYNGFGGDVGVQSGEFGAASLGSLSGSLGSNSVSVLSSLQAWSATPANNRGWIVLPTNTDGVRARSSDHATVTDRPKLTVTFIPPPPCQNAGDCNDNDGCTIDVCDTGVCEHTPMACNDGDPCTADQCSAGSCSFAPIPCPPGVLGDMNCDGLINAADVPAFALALVDATAYASAYPTCNIRRGDTNADTLIDGADVQSFIDLVIP